VKKQYSSWIKFYRYWHTNVIIGPKRKRQNTEENTIECKIEFAQMNFIVCLNLPHDNLVNMLPFAHVTYPKTKHDPNFGGGHYFLDVMEQLNSCSRSIFICMTSILSTNVATSILNVNEYPLALKSSFADHSKRKVMQVVDSKIQYTWEDPSRNNICSKIIFLEMTPYREKIMYPSLECRKKILNNNDLSDCIIIYK
jgi:hypothetical protein